jgi:lia operon protein LiaH
MGRIKSLIQTKGEIFMANLFKRMKESISQDLHELLDEKEQHNPIAKLNHYLRESEAETEKVRQLVARQYRLKEEFTREYEQAGQMAAKRREQAAIAQKAGEETMMQFAVKEATKYEERTSQIKTALNEAVQQLETLEEKYEEMKHRLKDMQLRRMELMGRENTARAHYHFNQAAKDQANDSYSRFSEIDQYIKNIEHKVNSSYYYNTFDSKIAELEKRLKS